MAYITDSSFEEMCPVLLASCLHQPFLVYNLLPACLLILSGWDIDSHDKWGIKRDLCLYGVLTFLKIYIVPLVQLSEEVKESTYKDKFNLDLYELGVIKFQ